MNGVQEIIELHRAWQQETGQHALPLDMARQNLWGQWAVAIRPMCDPGQPLSNAVRALCRYRRRKYRDSRHVLISTLAFRYFVGNVDYAQEDLAEAKARQRARAGKSAPGLAAVCHATGRGVPSESVKETRAARPAGEILAHIREMKELVAAA